MKNTEKGDQTCAAVMKKDSDSTSLQYVYMPSCLVKNFTPQKVKQWGSRIEKGAKAYFKYVAKTKTNYGIGYKFDATWVKNS